MNKNSGPGDVHAKKSIDRLVSLTFFRHSLGVVNITGTKMLLKPGGFGKRDSKCQPPSLGSKQTRASKEVLRGRSFKGRPFLMPVFLSKKAAPLRPAVGSTDRWPGTFFIAINA